MSIRIVTDSAADLSAEVVEAYRIAVAPLYINTPETGYRDVTEISAPELYARLERADEPVTTAPPSPEVVRHVYDGLVAEGASAILSIHLSAHLSNVIHVAALAAKQIVDIPVKVLDSRQLSLGTGFAVERAAQAAAEGLGIDEIIATVDEQILRTRVCIMLNSLTYLKRSGRVHWLVASLGGAIEVTPILHMYDGEPGAERARTGAQARARLVEILRREAPLERVAIIHTAAPDRAKELRRAASDLLDGLDVPTVPMSPVLGVHLGPGAVGFASVSRRTPTRRR